MKNLLHILVILMIFSSCSQKMAPIQEKGHITYGRNNLYNQNKYKAQNNKAIRSIIVMYGDNIYEIAKRNNVPLRDLISKNNLQPPYFLKAGDKLVLPGAAYHRVVSGDTLYDISRSYGMNLSALIKINNLKPPYRLKVGDKVRINNHLPSKRLASSNNAVSAVSKRRYSQSKSIKSGELSSPARVVNKSNKFIKPLHGKVISKFGYKAGGLYNDGINIKSQEGSSVKAIEDGVVAYAGNELRGYGNLIIIKHSKGWISAYGHLSKSNIKRGDKVSKGQVIASVGSTGNVKTPQLYFGLRKGREAVNPESYI